MSEFFAMGGYGAYVWSAFGFSAICMLGLLWQSWSRSRRLAVELEELRRELRPRPGRPERTQPLRPRRADNGS